MVEPLKSHVHRDANRRHVLLLLLLLLLLSLLLLLFLLFLLFLLLLRLLLRHRPSRRAWQRWLCCSTSRHRRGRREPTPTAGRAARSHR